MSTLWSALPSRTHCGKPCQAYSTLPTTRGGGPIFISQTENLTSRSSGAVLLTIQNVLAGTKSQAQALTPDPGFGGLGYKKD